MSSARMYDDEEARGGFPWFMLTGLIFGLLVGVFTAWLLAPIQYTNASPASLNAADKDHYRAIIALAYKADADRGRAEARLKLLKDSSPAEMVAFEAQQYLDGKGPAEEAQALSDLASALRQAQPIPAVQQPVKQEGQPVADIRTSTQSATPLNSITVTPTETGSPLLVSTFTPSPFPTLPVAPTLTPSATPGPPFRLIGQLPICNPELEAGLLQVEVEDSSTAPVAGVRIQISWKDGSDFFFTGLAPEISPGYGDFVMSPGQEYTLVVGDNGLPISGVIPPQCNRADGSRYLGGVKLQFRQ
jgi:hypothetical protein